MVQMRGSLLGLAAPGGGSEGPIERESSSRWGSDAGRESSLDFPFGEEDSGADGLDGSPSAGKGRGRCSVGSCGVSLGRSFIRTASLGCCRASSLGASPWGGFAVGGWVSAMMCVVEVKRPSDIGGNKRVVARISQGVMRRW